MLGERKDLDTCINGWVSITLGFILIGISCYYLFHGFPKIAKEQSTAVSITALKVSSWLAISGVIMIFLGLLYLMEIIPWWS